MEISGETTNRIVDIIKFFERRATNAAAESFNAKIKAFPLSHKNKISDLDKEYKKSFINQ